MARHVDRVEREREISVAAMKILSTRGPKGLTLRSLAKELGGSQTLVTHFYANRTELFRAVTDWLIASYDDDLAELEEGADDAARLSLLIGWMLPLTAEAQSQERGRVMLVGHREEDDSVRHFFEAMDYKMRQLLHDHLKPLVPAAQLDVHVDILRVAINGIVLSSAEHPGTWTAERQLRLINHLLSSLGIHRDARASLT